MKRALRPLYCSSVDNPFERYDLDPHAGIGAITERLRELSEDAKTEEEREALRAAWEELTLHPARRLRAALFAHPETRAPLGAPPPLPRSRRATEAGPHAADRLAPRPSLLAAVDVARDESAAPPLGDDPVLRPGR